MIHKVKNPLLYVAFITGAMLMVYELVAARILAPTLGSSLYVWTSVIGVMIAALSLGYWAGGVLADLRNHRYDIAYMLLVLAFCIIWTAMAYDYILGSYSTVDMDVRLKGVLVSLFLFAPASFVLGAIGPYLAKLEVKYLTKTGRSVANLSALNSIGGIVGTFVTGFILFSYVGSHAIVLYLAVVSIVLSWLVQPRHQTVRRLIVTVVGGIVLLSLASSYTPIIRIDTAMARYEIHNYTLDGKPMRGIVSGPNGIQSGVYIDNPDGQPFWYTRQFSRIAGQLKDPPQRILMLGGGALTAPRLMARQYPDAQIDVVEIDEQLPDIARQYFFYDDPDNVSIIIDDARSYINKNKHTYDVIYVDVYADNMIPASMVTKEYVKTLSQSLTPQGYVVANVIGSMRAGHPCRDSIGVIDAGYRTVFKHGAIAMRDPYLSRGNMILVYGREAIALDGYKVFDAMGYSAYTDDFAPIERNVRACYAQKVTI